MKNLVNKDTIEFLKWITAVMFSATVLLITCAGYIYIMGAVSSCIGFYPHWSSCH